MCNDCGRSFNERAFRKHPDICKRVFLTKRPAYKPNRVASKEFREYESNSTRTSQTREKQI